MEEVRERKSPKRLVVDIDETVHQRLKLVAVKRNISIRTYISRIILRALRDEEREEDGR